jgi:hypothetical protein
MLCRAVPIAAFALAPAFPAFSQSVTELNGGAVSVTEIPEVDYEFGEKEWREKAQDELELDRESRESTQSEEELMEAAPVEEKVLTNVEPGDDAEEAGDGKEVIYRDVGNDADEVEGVDTDATESAETVPGYLDYWDETADGIAVEDGGEPELTERDEDVLRVGPGPDKAATLPVSPAPSVPAPNADNYESDDFTVVDPEDLESP